MPGNTDRRRKLFEGVIRFSDGTVDEFQQSLVKIARWLDDEVRALAVTLDLQAGRFLTTSPNLARAVGMRHQIDVLLARTAISELHATMSNNLAAQAGIKHFEYVGPLVSTSRQFCIAHRGKVYTRAQIAKMDNGQTGKGTVLVARGGYNCNHQWMPVIVEDEIVPPSTPETPSQVAA